MSSNDTFRAVSRYWDRLQRPEQAITALPEVMRVLTSPADTGAVVLALPQDIQVIFMIILHNYIGHIHFLPSHGHLMWLVTAGSKNGAPKGEYSR